MYYREQLNFQHHLTEINSQCYGHSLIRAVSPVSSVQKRKLTILKEIWKHPYFLLVNLHFLGKPFLISQVQEHQQMEPGKDKGINKEHLIKLPHNHFNSVTVYLLDNNVYLNFTLK